MSKLVMALAFMCLIPVAAFPQDDLYFVPQELHEEYDTEMFDAPVEMPTVGSVRDVDEYNRRGTYLQQIDSAGNDIIDFDGIAGVYPDTLTDYACTRNMSRFDDYDWFDTYWAGYNDGRWDLLWWNDPWRYGYWYDPWFHVGWGYYPWHYYSWHPYYHHWHVGSYYRPYRGVTGTANHGNVNHGGRRPGGTGFRGVRSGTNVTGNVNRRVVRNFNSNRNSNRVSTPTRRPSYSSGNSFGGSRSGGGFSGSRGGGSRGGGGGGFRGRR